MTPIVEVWLNGQNISSRLAGRVLQAEIAETDGENTDTLRLSVSNYDGRLKKPAVGAVLDVRLGWQEVGIAKQGSFKVQEVTKHGEAARFDITAQAAGLDKTLKTQKNRNWQAPKTYGDVFKQIAGDNGLSAAVHGSIAQIKIEKVVAQHGESDMHFATRLARSVGAIAKVAEGKLVIVPKGQGESASGQSIPALAVISTLSRARPAARATSRRLIMRRCARRSRAPISPTTATTATWRSPPWSPARPISWRSGGRSSPTRIWWSVCGMAPRWPMWTAPRFMAAAPMATPIIPSAPDKTRRRRRGLRERRSP